MIDLASRFGMAAALMSFAIGSPVIAQTLGAEVNSCVLESAKNVRIGNVNSIAAAITKARDAGVESGSYAIATIGSGSEQRTLAIDAEGVGHFVSEGICAGSGPRLRPPE